MLIQKRCPENCYLELCKGTKRLFDQTNSLVEENKRLRNRTKKLEEESRKKPKLSQEKTDSDYTIEDVNKDPSLLHKRDLLLWASPELKNDFDIVMKVVKRHPFQLAYASKEFKNNFQIVMAAVTSEYRDLTEYGWF